MTYPELKIALDIGDPETILSSLTNPYNHKDKKSCGLYFIVCNDRDIHCFDKRGREQKIDHIPDYCFKCDQTLEKIVIPDSVTNIGYGAFEVCSNLKNVTISNNVKSIENWAFRACTNLANITIPNSVTSINRGTFIDCSALENVTIGNGVTSIRCWAFENCINLTSIKIPNRIKLIEEQAFVGCDILKSVVFEGKTIEQVKAMPFYPWGIEDKSIFKAMP